MPRTSRPDVVCMYCETPGFAWGHPPGSSKHVPYPALRDAAGAFVLSPKGKALPDRTQPPHRCEAYKAAKAALAAQQTAVPMTGTPKSAPVATQQQVNEITERLIGSGIAQPLTAQEPQTIIQPPTPAVTAATVEALKLRSRAAVTGSTTGRLSFDAPTVAATVQTKPAVNLPRAADLIQPEQLAEWRRYVAAIKETRVPQRVLAFGPPGTGKTDMPWRIAQLLGWGHVIQQMTEETPAVDILGRPSMKDGSEVWRPGTLERAIRESFTRPVVLVIDEVARASADAFSACILALTDPGALRLPLPDGTVIAPRLENWHVVATSNDEPNTLNEALQSRLFLRVNLTSPSPDMVDSFTTVEARRLACQRPTREYDLRALIAYDRLRAAGASLEEAAGLLWPATVAQSFVDAVRLESAK